MTRRLAILCLVAVTATACSSGPPDIDDVPIVGDATDATTAPPSDPATEPAPTEDGGTDAPTAGATGPDGQPGGDDQAGGGDDQAGGGDQPGDQDTPGLTPATDTGGVGVNGRAILRGDRPSLVIEVDVQSGATVDDQATAHLVDVLDDVVDKPAGIRFAGGNTFDSADTEWTTDDLRAAAAANRTTATTDEQVSIHVLYVRGGHHEDGEQTDAIGLAYSSSTIALFPDRWSGLGSLLGSGTAIERAVLVHEVGHLLGLVNLTYTSEIDHEDPEHPGHSRNEDSVMFHAVESTLVGQVFSGPPPDTFDLDDLADLEGLRTGRY